MRGQTKTARAVTIFTGAVGQWVRSQPNARRRKATFPENANRAAKCGALTHQSSCKCVKVTCAVLDPRLVWWLTETITPPTDSSGPKPPNACPASTKWPPTLTECCYATNTRFGRQLAANSLLFCTAPGWAGEKRASAFSPPLGTTETCGHADQPHAPHNVATAVTTACSDSHDSHGIARKPSETAPTSHPEKALCHMVGGQDVRLAANSLWTICSWPQLPATDGGRFPGSALVATHQSQNHARPTGPNRLRARVRANHREPTQTNALGVSAAIMLVGS
jgi:hypothetical protein